MSFICRLCDRTFETILAGSIEIGRAHGFRHQFQIVRFPDGFVHNLKRLNPPPKQATELLTATIQALLELPTPPEPATSLSIAFRRFQNN